MNPSIDKQNIIAILGLETLPDEQKLGIVEKVSDLVQKRLMIRIVESLSVPDRVDLEKLLAKNDPDSLQGFLANRVPFLARWADEEVAKIKTELAEFVEQQA